MSISEAVTRPISEAASPSATDAAPASGSDAASSSSRQSAALLVATLFTLGSVGALGYTQWWAPREQAQQTAQVNYYHCLDEVKVYRGSHSYTGRLAQCTEFLSD